MKELVQIILNINIFDLAFIVIIVYSIIQCFIKGFSLSFISFMKWIFALGNNYFSSETATLGQ